MDLQTDIAGNAKYLLKGVIISIAVTMLLMILSALLLFLTDMGSGAVKISVYIIFIAASLAGGWVAGHSIRYRKFLWGLLTGCLYYLIICVAAAVTGNAAGDGFSIQTPALLICLGSSMLGGMLG